MHTKKYKILRKEIGKDTHKRTISLPPQKTISHDQGLLLLVVVRLLSCVYLFAILWTVPLGFPRQEYWSWAISFSRGSSRPRDQTHVSCTGSKILYR